MNTILAGMPFNSIEWIRSRASLKALDPRRHLSIPLNGFARDTARSNQHDPEVLSIPLNGFSGGPKGRGHRGTGSFQFH